MQHRFLIIQTAFIGDVVLATALVEKLAQYYPDARIDFVLRKGNEQLLQGHPRIHRLHIWDKGKGKLRHLWKLSQEIRAEHYTVVINPHRAATTGFLTWRSGAHERRGFKQNPLSGTYTHTFEHRFSKPGDPKPVHETERNQQLISGLTDTTPAKPHLYPLPKDYESVACYTDKPYICVAPASVWETKRFPPELWVSLIQLLPAHYPVYLLGGPGDLALGKDIAERSGRENVINLCGTLHLMESIALIGGAAMNYTNDSGPLHFASALNAPTTAVYCSTDPCFGFGPLADVQRVVSLEGLYCKPCGLHGYPACPQGHFRCAKDLNIKDLLWWISPKI